jgi:hypothetical protein
MRRTLERSMMVLAAVLFLGACGPAYIIDDQPVAYAGGVAPVGPAPAAMAVAGDPLVGYWGPHPVPTDFGGGFDFTEGPHTRPYYPMYPDLYVLQDGYYVFIGDPYFYGYTGPMRWYAGPHLMHYPWGEVVCNIDGPHRHWEHNTVYVYDTEYIYEDGFYVYVGFWPSWYVSSSRRVHLHHYWPRRYRDHYRPMVGRSQRAVHKHPPKHVSHGSVGHHKKTPQTQGVPRPGAAGSAGPAGNSGHRNPGILPAYDENRSERQRAMGEKGTAGVYRSGEKQRPGVSETRTRANTRPGVSGARRGETGATGRHLPAYDNSRGGAGRSGQGTTSDGRRLPATPAAGGARRDLGPTGGHLPAYDNSRGSAGRSGAGTTRDPRGLPAAPAASGARRDLGPTGGHLPAYDNSRGSAGRPGVGATDARGTRRGGDVPATQSDRRGSPGDAGRTQRPTTSSGGNWKGPSNTNVRKPGQGSYPTKRGSTSGSSAPKGTYGNYPKLQAPNATKPNYPSAPTTQRSYNTKARSSSSPSKASTSSSSRKKSSSYKKASSSSSKKKAPSTRSSGSRSTPKARSNKSSGSSRSRQRR